MINEKKQRIFKKNKKKSVVSKIFIINLQRF